MTKGLSQKAQNEVLAIVRDHWVLLVKIANRYWNNEGPPVAEAKQRTFTCQGCKKKYDFTPPGAVQFGKYKCTGCGKQKVVEDE